MALRGARPARQGPSALFPFPSRPAHTHTHTPLESLASPHTLYLIFTIAMCARRFCRRRAAGGAPAQPGAPRAASCSHSRSRSRATSVCPSVCPSRCCLPLTLLPITTGAGVRCNLDPAAGLLQGARLGGDLLHGWAGPQACSGDRPWRRCGGEGPSPALRALRLGPLACWQLSAGALRPVYKERAGLLVGSGKACMNG